MAATMVVPVDQRRGGAMPILHRATLRVQFPKSNAPPLKQNIAISTTYPNSSKKIDFLKTKFRVFLQLILANRGNCFYFYHKISRKSRKFRKEEAFQKPQANLSNSMRSSTLSVAVADDISTSFLKLDKLLDQWRYSCTNKIKVIELIRAIKAMKVWNSGRSFDEMKRGTPWFVIICDVKRGHELETGSQNGVQEKIPILANGVIILEGEFISNQLK